MHKQRVITAAAPKGCLRERVVLLALNSYEC